MLVLVAPRTSIPARTPGWPTNASRWKADPASVDPAWRVIFEGPKPPTVSAPQRAADTGADRVPSVDVTDHRCAGGQVKLPADAA